MGLCNLVVDGTLQAPRGRFCFQPMVRTGSLSRPHPLMKMEVIRYWFLEQVSVVAGDIRVIAWPVPASIPHEKQRIDTVGCCASFNGAL